MPSVHGVILGRLPTLRARLRLPSRAPADLLQWRGPAAPADAVVVVVQVERLAGQHRQAASDAWLSVGEWQSGPSERLVFTAVVRHTLILSDQTDILEA